MINNTTANLRSGNRNSQKSENHKTNPANSNKTITLSLIMDPGKPTEPKNPMNETRASQ